METVNIKSENKSVTTTEIKVPSWWKMAHSAGFFLYYFIYEENGKAVHDCITHYTMISVSIVTGLPTDNIPILDCVPITKEQYQYVLRMTIERANFNSLTKNCGEGNQ
jgi:hypothetical protein